MPVTSIDERRKDRFDRRAPKRVAALILEDGTVRPVEEASSGTDPGTDWASGQITGPDWVLWWERRSWSER
jgi:hypothetical protein